MNQNLIRSCIAAKESNILNVYFTAGYPNLNDTVEIIQSLSESGVDLIELGMPYSDPLADGTTIQQSSELALKNGMSLDILFAQINEARKTINTPIILMGYFNQLLQFGVESFLQRASSVGVNGMIVPDLPMDIYEEEYQEMFENYNISMSFLISPMTSEERIRQADRLSSAFIYVVSQSSITGKSSEISAHQKEYFEKIEKMQLNTPRLIGFGIHDADSFRTACNYAHGAIVGSAFIRTLHESSNLKKSISSFISNLKK
jgi:tryptophan synthase alpha chain